MGPNIENIQKPLVISVEPDRLHIYIYALLLYNILILLRQVSIQFILYGNTFKSNTKK